jgi:hypothetical protein
MNPDYYNEYFEKYLRNYNLADDKREWYEEMEKKECLWNDYITIEDSEDSFFSNHYLKKQIHYRPPEDAQTTTPKVGHLVRFSSDVDLIPVGTTGLIVAARGIEIQVMMSDSSMVWIRRDLVEVIK